MTACLASFGAKVQAKQGTWEGRQAAGLGRKGAMAGTPPAQGCHKDLMVDCCVVGEGEAGTGWPAGH